MELLLNTEDLLSLLRGLFTLSQDLARDETGAKRVGAIGRGRFWDDDDDDGGGGGCCGGVCGCCGATVILSIVAFNRRCICLFGGGNFSGWNVDGRPW